MSALPYGPVPRPTAVSAPHWSGGKNGELRVQQCDGCARYVFNPAPVCPFCTSTDLTWRTSSGRGSVHTMTTVHRAPTPGVETPYVVVVVAMEEGWHMLSNIVGCDPADVHIDMPVRVDFVDVSDEVALPVFRLAEAW
jgi:hypothetical protein